ncbi:hypothetical protein HY463_01655 [Candidatus Peregrinibacteria bacterium]|nr:hypothetical protein [Candidatus Peregrinibacteria bacterium]
MNYKRIAVLGLGLLLPPCNREAPIDNAAPIVESRQTVNREVFTLLADTFQKNREEADRLKHQQALEDDFWDNANELSDNLNSIGFDSLVYEGTSDKGLSYAYVKFRLMGSTYWFSLPNPENIKSEFKYNFVFFVNDDRSYIAANGMDEVMDQIADIINSQDPD